MANVQVQAKANLINIPQQNHQEWKPYLELQRVHYTHSVQKHYRTQQKVSFLNNNFKKRQQTFRCLNISKVEMNFEFNSSPLKSMRKKLPSVNVQKQITKNFRTLSKKKKEHLSRQKVFYINSKQIKQREIDHNYLLSLLDKNKRYQKGFLNDKISTKKISKTEGKYGNECLVLKPKLLQNFSYVRSRTMRIPQRGSRGNQFFTDEIFCNRRQVQRCKKYQKQQRYLN